MSETNEENSDLDKMTEEIEYCRKRRDENTILGYYINTLHGLTYLNLKLLSCNILTGTEVYSLSLNSIKQFYIIFPLSPHIMVAIQN